MPGHRRRRWKVYEEKLPPFCHMAHDVDVVGGLFLTHTRGTLLFFLRLLCVFFCFFVALHSFIHSIPFTHSLVFALLRNFPRFSSSSPSSPQPQGYFCLLMVWWRYAYIFENIKMLFKTFISTTSKTHSPLKALLSFSLLGSPSVWVCAYVCVCVCEPAHSLARCNC